MGATYTRQSSTEIVDGEVINAADFNNEFAQLVSAFAVSTGHSHDGTAAEGGPVTKLLGTAITIGDGSSGTDIAVTFDGETSDGLLTWMEDEDHFKFSDDVVIDSSKRLYLYDEGGEYLSGDGTDITVTSGADINLTATSDVNIPANVGVTFGNDGEKIEGDGTDLTISGNNINLTATADVNIPSGVGITFATAEKIESDGTDLSITVGSGGDINIPADIGLTFGNDGEKIEGDGTDLTISGNNINLTATADVNIPSGVGITFATAEKIESDGTDLSITVGSGGDVNIPADIGVTFGNDGEKIEGDGTDLTISSSALLNLDADTDIVLDANGGDIFFKDDGTTFGSATNTSGNLIIKSGTTTALTFSGADVTVAGDLTVSGDDITMATNTDTAIMVADGTNFNPVVPSGDVGLTNAGVFSIASGVIVNADINASAAIADSKLATITTADKVSGAAIQVDGATDGTSITIASTDKFLVDDAGTTKYVNASQVAALASSPAADDIATGDAAVTIETSSGDVTIDSNAGTTTVDGHTGVTVQSTNSGDILLDSAADVVLDAAGNDITLKASGTVFGSMTNSSGELIVKSGSSPTTAITFSGANATVAGNLTVSGTLVSADVTALAVALG